MINVGGRPPILDKKESEKLRKLYLEYKATTSDFLRELQIKRSTFYRYLREWNIKTLRVGIDGSTLGLSCYSPHLNRIIKDKRVAYDVAIASVVAQSLRVRAQLVPLVPSRSIVAIAKEQVDCVISRLGNTSERCLSANFTAGYLPMRTAPMRLFGRREIFFSGVDPKKWRPIVFAVQQSSVNESFLSGSTHKLKYCQNELQTFEMVSSGRADALLIDKDHLHNDALNSLRLSDCEIKPLALDYGIEPCIAIKKADNLLQDSFCKIIDEMQRSGFIERLYTSFHRT